MAWASACWESWLVPDRIGDLAGCFWSIAWSDGRALPCPLPSFLPDLQAGNPFAWSLLLSLLRSLMWRNTKPSVASQLGLPPQRSSLSCLRMSAVEAHFYARQHARCAARAAAIVRALRSLQRGAQAGDGDQADAARQPGNARGPASNAAAVTTSAGLAPPKTKTSSRESPIPSGTSANASSTGSGSGSGSLVACCRSSHQRAAVERFLSSLLLLRQACCHPQIGGGGLRPLTASRPMNMDEVLQVNGEGGRERGEAGGLGG